MQLQPINLMQLLLSYLQYFLSNWTDVGFQIAQINVSRVTLHVKVLVDDKLLCSCL